MPISDDDLQRYEAALEEERRKFREAVAGFRWLLLPALLGAFFVIWRAANGGF